MLPGWRADFAAQAYRVGADRALRATWAVLLIDLPLFLLIDWTTWSSGQWDTQPAHERIFWWRVVLTLLLPSLLAMRYFTKNEALRNRRFAWASAFAFPLMGAWFVVVCQTLITDASIYVLFLIGVSVLFPLPTLHKLWIYPASLAVLLLGFHWVHAEAIPAFHVAVNAACAALGAFVTEAVAMRTYAADYAKSRLLDDERRRADALLRNVLPPQIVDRLQPGGVNTMVEYHPEISVLFANFVGFGKLTQTLPPGEMIALLDALFLEFDEAAERFGVEKIKTMGDGYMAACGVPVAAPDHASRVAELALRMQSIARRFKSDRNLPVHVRIGIHTGPAIAGIIGRKKFCYDLWGETINTGAHLQSAGAPDRIHLSDTMCRALGEQYRFETHGPLLLKDRLPIQTCYLLGRAGEGDIFKDRFKGELPRSPAAAAPRPEYRPASSAQIAVAGRAFPRVGDSTDDCA